MLHDVRFNFSAEFGTPCTIDADLYVEDGASLNVGNMELKFFHTPGHSPAGCAFTLRRKTFCSAEYAVQTVDRKNGFSRMLL